MSAYELATPSVDGDALRFDLHVYAELPTRPWRVELLDDTGRRRSFATPVELARHLARLGWPSAGDQGLR